jgi:hypothetical protein
MIKPKESVRPVRERQKRCLRLASKRSRKTVELVLIRHVLFRRKTFYLNVTLRGSARKFPEKG